jgi:hypothetical protein
MFFAICAGHNFISDDAFLTKLYKVYDIWYDMIWFLDFFQSGADHSPVLGSDIG